MTNLVAAMLDQIEPVVAKRERWRGYAKEHDSEIAYAPGVALMTAAIEARQDRARQDRRHEVAARPRRPERLRRRGLSARGLHRLDRVGYQHEAWNGPGTKDSRRRSAT